MALDPIVWALKDAPVSDAGERLILTVLAEHSNEDGTSAFPSQATIARIAMCTDRSVRNKLKAMEDRRLIVRGDQRLVEVFPRDKRPIVWDLAIPYSWWGVRWDRMNLSRITRGQRPLEPADRPDLTVDGPVVAGESGRNLVPAARPERGSGRNVVPQRPEPDSGGDRNVVPTTLPYYPPQDPPLSISSDEADAETQTDALLVVPGMPVTTAKVSVEDEFEQWYATYPRKVARGNALKAFKGARKKVSLEVLLAGLEGYKNRVRGSEAQFIAHPATWLNGERWTDETDAQTQARVGAPANGGFFAASDSDLTATAAMFDDDTWGPEALASTASPHPF